MPRVTADRHREPAVEVWTRGDDGSWTCAIAREGEVAHLTPIGADIDVRELYAAAAPPSA